MLEDLMSVWPKTLPVAPSLSTAEGALVSVSIHVEPHCLESLLEALAQVSFPINPQIYHDAALIYRYADGREQTESITLVEFPAYEGRLDEVRSAARGLRLPAGMHARRQHAGRHPVGLAEGTRAGRRSLCLALSSEAPRGRWPERRKRSCRTAGWQFLQNHSRRPRFAPCRCITFSVVLFTTESCFAGYSRNNLRHNTLNRVTVLLKQWRQVLPGMAMVPRISRNGRVRKAEILACAWMVTSGCLSAQVLMPASGPGGAVRLFTSDAAILEAREVRKDVPCTVTPVKPVLGFDLKFHAGYDVSMPLKDLAGSDNMLTMVFRVAPDQKPDDAVYFSQRLNVPMIEADAGGNAVLSGAFDVGEGKYHVDWLMRDRSERVCSFNWDSEATLPAKDKQIALDIAGQRRAAGRHRTFQAGTRRRAREARPTRSTSKVMVNFAPQDSLSATLQPLDTRALISILRNMARDPRIARFSIVAFNMQEQRVIYRQESAAQIDFPALGEALHSLNLGTVDLKRLSPEARRCRIPGQFHHPGDQGRQGPAGRRDYRRSESHRRRRPAAGILQGGRRPEVPGLLHELQPESAGKSVARRHRIGGEDPQGRRIHHQPSARPVFCLDRDHRPYCKIKVRKDGNRECRCTRQIKHAGLSYCVRHRFGCVPGRRPEVRGG